MTSSKKRTEELDNKILRARFRLWVETEDGRPFLGPGRVRLLERIAELGSIAKAANELGMSYRKAWELIRSMNETSKQELVERRVGGRDGGGAVLSETGKYLVQKYRNIQSMADKQMEAYAKKFSM